MAIPHLPIDADYHVAPHRDGFRSGIVFHIKRNAVGSGWVSTPIARFFVTRPDIGAEGYNLYERLDCYVRDHPLSPDDGWLARRLADALLAEGVVTEPLWIGWHHARESGGEARGQVFED